MDVDYKGLERQAGLIDLVEPDLGNKLQQLLSDLRAKNDAYNKHCKSKLKAGPSHNKLAADLEVAITSILKFFTEYGYVARKVTSDMWGTHHLAVHPLYAQAFDEGSWHFLLGWESNMGNVPIWAAVIIHPPLIDRIMWDEE